MQRRLEQLGFLPSLVISACSGFIVALGAPPDGWLATSFIGFAPLILMVMRDRVSLREAAVFGVAGGMGIGLGGFPWISEMLVKFAGVPEVGGWIGLFFFSLWMAIPYGIWAVGLRKGPRSGIVGWIWAVVLFAALQYSWPVLFPYSPFLGFAETPQMMQLAELVGVHGVEAVVVSASIALSRCVVAPNSRLRVSYALIWLTTPLLMYSIGDLRMQAIDREAVGAPTLRVAIIQPNIGIDRIPSRIHMERLREPSRRAEELGAELIVWPEAGTYPYPIERPFTGDSKRDERRVLLHHRTPTVFGAGSRVRGARFSYNSAYYVDEEGRPLGRYDKVNLVPLGESIPIIDPHWLTDRIPEIGHRERGLAPARFVVRLPESRVPAKGDTAPDEIAFAPLICYEDIIPDYVRRAAAQEGGVDLFVNMTIDSWYGDTAEPWEHLALAQFRSVEHRIPLVRSVSTGVSAVVDSNGRLVAHVPLRPVMPDSLDEYPPEILMETLSLSRNTAREPTIFARVGWLFPHVCQLIVLVAALRWWILARRQRIQAGDPG
ncbi:MAG: apolipoprotein N-acyltransferase [Deltaproteobacteria bacterium]|nr:apolipoprotein N-acyltransferase [Deltaproteobacteria bacterium]MBW2723026.1 apolipoprotein N-acyltransferase [Deltaproteobacteria bacterium]